MKGSNPCYRVVLTFVRKGWKEFDLQDAINISIQSRIDTWRIDTLNYYWYLFLGSIFRNSRSKHHKNQGPNTPAMRDRPAASLSLISTFILRNSNGLPSSTSSYHPTNVTYDSRFLFLDHIPASVSLSGDCYLGHEMIDCSALRLGSSFGYVLSQRPSAPMPKNENSSRWWLFPEQ